MSEDVDDGFVVRAMLVMSPRNSREQVELLRRSVGALGTFEGEPLTGYDPRSKAFAAGGDAPDDMTVLLTHPRFEGLWEDDNGWVNLSVLDDGPTQPSYVFLSTNIGPAAGQIDRQWTVAKALVPRLAKELEPDLGFINGKPVSDEVFDTFPSPSEFRDAGLPAAITPWTYLGSKRLRETENSEWLAALPVHDVRPLGSGVSVSVIERLQDLPSRKLHDALAAAPGGRVRYIAPKLSS